LSNKDGTLISVQVDDFLTEAVRHGLIFTKDGLPVEIGKSFDVNSATVTTKDGNKELAKDVLSVLEKL